MAVEQQTISPNPAYLMDNQMTYSFIHKNGANDVNLKPTYIGHPIEFHTSEACPKNLIIFDQNFNGSQVTFHPTIAPKFCEREREREIELSLIKEDSEDIDALLMSSEEVVGSSEEDEVSTGRTAGNYGNESPDSPSTCNSSGSKRRNGNYRFKRTRNVMKMLKKIVPGGERMSTSDVLDEAVKYLKYLKMEALKLEKRN